MNKMISIKQITANDDLNKIVLEIQGATWVAASEISPEDYSVEDLKEYLLKTETVFLVAYSDEKLAGMASAKILNKPTGDIWLYIDEVDVCEDKQRQGVGRELMAYMIKFAQEYDCDEVWIGSEVDNIPANALYNSLNPSEIQKCIGYTFIIKR